ncbi:MAG: CGNR zinc finger domain-containing protein [Solirubrobacteraceae bacterium]
MPATSASAGLIEELQPGDRTPAPGDLGLVQAFANTFWDLERHRPERLRSPSALTAWLRRRGLLDRRVRLGEGDLRRALEVREGIRALLFANSGARPDQDAIARLNAGLRGASVITRLHAAGRPEFVAPDRRLDGALALIAASVAVAQLEGRFGRLKACPGPECGWAFYDHSRNLAGTWCSMSICGARVKARYYRQRRRHADGA